MPERKPRTRVHAYALLGSAGVAALLSGCAEDAPQDTWKPKGENAQKIHDLQWPVFLVAGDRRRHRDGRRRLRDLPLQGPGPADARADARQAGARDRAHDPAALILAGVGIPTVKHDLRPRRGERHRVHRQRHRTAVVVGVRLPGAGGLRWASRADRHERSARHPGRHQRAAAHHEPRRHPLVLDPALNGKKDAVPGRVHTLRMQADQPGIYAGQCTEFCGLSHANMKMEAVALYPTTSPRGSRTSSSLRPRPRTARSRRPARPVHRQLRLLPPGERSQLDRPGRHRHPRARQPRPVHRVGRRPNLTNLMTRNTFAGATWDLLTEECRDRRVERLARGVRCAVPAGCHGRVPERGRPARVDPQRAGQEADVREREPEGRRRRQGPRHAGNLGLNETQIDQIIAYLLERN
jgi:cytochrome c oxidase subunit 2